MALDKLAAPLPADVPVATDIAGLARLKSAAQANTPEALAAVAQQFEALFLDMMLKSMRDASLGDGMFDSETGELYQGMFDKQVALDLARGKGLGIADMLIRQLSPKAPAAAPGAEGANPLFPLGRSRGGPLPAATTFNATSPSAVAPATPRASGARVEEAWARSPADFIREVLPHARAAARQLGVHPLGLVAQAALETGWGKRVVTRQDGSSSLNMFGIKAGAHWQGERTSAGTLEFDGGLPVRRTESFRSYGSIAESFADYVELMSTSPRYREVLEAGADTGRFAESIGRSGYATDPAYAEKLKGLLDGDTLRGALAALKKAEGQPI